MFISKQLKENNIAEYLIYCLLYTSVAADE